jgi:hypothetical protein
MTTTTILLLLLSIVLAGGLSYLQYFFKVGIKNKIHPLLALLRFITIFGILLLLINPKITRNTFEIQKTPLPVVVDNSSSVKELKATETTLALYKKLTTNKGLQEKFEIQSYQFDNELQLSENFNFSGTQTNLEEVATKKGHFHPLLLPTAIRPPVMITSIVLMLPIKYILSLLAIPQPFLI